ADRAVPPRGRSLPGWSWELVKAARRRASSAVRRFAMARKLPGGRQRYLRRVTTFRLASPTPASYRRTPQLSCRADARANELVRAEPWDHEQPARSTAAPGSPPYRLTPVPQ